MEITMPTTAMRKITPKGIFSGEWKQPEKKTFVCRILGRVTGMTDDKTQYGEFKRFTGAFVAYNNVGEEFSSRNLIVPGVQEDEIAYYLDTLAEDESKSVEFAVDIYITPVADKKVEGKMSYEWRVESLIEAKPDDAIARLKTFAPPLPGGLALTGPQGSLDVKQPAPGETGDKAEAIVTETEKTIEQPASPAAGHKKK